MGDVSVLPGKIDLVGAFRSLTDMGTQVIEVV